MFSTTEMPSLSSLFSAFASIMASIIFLQSMLHQILPKQLRDYLIILFQDLFKAHTPILTLVFHKGNEFGGRNQIYEAASVYLDTLCRGTETKRLNVCKNPKEKGLVFRLENGEKVTDLYQGIELQWRFVCSKPEKNSLRNSSEKRNYELSFHNKHEDKVSNSYLPFVLDKAKVISDEKRVLKMHSEQFL
ncbi:AAA-type ATPase, N-terminal domain containing protein [Parasponia andersonii]|uniref:AAA-type ATPase, N-terminal domain containing protein n=1 Tax=Parasponia andersonii TaxID=3476 RepID=A0A2P5DDV0_PARAD|nr:AAA-type ATPase, N-terminal domain containing protein [Parasponia andersonii]